MNGRGLMMLRNVKMTNNLRKILNPITKNTVKVTNSLRKKLLNPIMKNTVKHRE
jgi:hypothetical protein